MSILNICIVSKKNMILFSSLCSKIKKQINGAEIYVNNDCYLTREIVVPSKTSTIFVNKICKLMSGITEEIRFNCLSITFNDFINLICSCAHIRSVIIEDVSIYGDVKYVEPCSIKFNTEEILLIHNMSPIPLDEYLKKFFDQFNHKCKIDEISKENYYFGM